MAVFLVRGGALINSPCDERLRTPADSFKAPGSRAMRVRTDFCLPITSERHRLWPLFRNSWPRMGPESICGGRGRCAVRCHYLATLVLDSHSKAKGHLSGDLPPRVAFFGSGFGQCQPTEPGKKRGRHFLVRKVRGLQEIWGDHPDELGAPRRFE